MTPKHLCAYVLCAALPFSLAACSKKTDDNKGDPAPEEKAEATPKAEPAAPKTPAEPEVPELAEPVMTEADIKASFETWLAAQNSGDFDAYAGQYGEKFTGIKRSGQKTFQYDHDGWVADRQRMFKKKMVVEAADLKIAPSARSAVLTFTQTWASGTYKDVGPKQLVFAPSQDGPRIVREEMISSTLADDEQPAEIPAANFGFFERGKTAMLILEDQIDASARKRAAGTSLSRGYSALFDIKDSSEPAKRHKDLVGKTLVFRDGAGEVCSGTVTKLGIMAEAVPHFGEMMYWDGEDDFGTGESEGRLSDARVAEELFKLASGSGLRLVAVTDANTDSCPGALWGHVEGAGVETYQIGDLAEEDSRFQRAFTELRNHKASKSLQRELERERGKGFVTPWFDVHPDRRTAFQFTDGTTMWVFARGELLGGCGDLEGQHWALWKVAGDSWTLLSSDKGTRGVVAPSAAADLDGDGNPELVSPDHLIQPVGPTHKLTRDIEAPYFDCPC